MSIHISESYTPFVRHTAEHYQVIASPLLDTVMQMEGVYGAMVYGSSCNNQASVAPNDIDLLVRTRHPDAREVHRVAQAVANASGIIIDLAIISDQTAAPNPFFVSSLRRSMERCGGWVKGKPLKDMRAVEDYPEAEQLPVARNSVIEGYNNTFLRMLRASRESQLNLPVLKQSLQLPLGMGRNGMQLIRLQEQGDYTSVLDMSANQLVEEFIEGFPLDRETIGDIQQLWQLNEQHGLLAADREGSDIWMRENEKEILGAGISAIASFRQRCKSIN